MKYAHYNAETGLILGFYDTEIHEQIPTPNIKLSNEAWQDAVNNRKKIVNGELIADPIIQTYAEKRAMEYPPIIDYIDGVVKGDQTQIQTYIYACLAIKNKYPKV